MLCKELSLSVSTLLKGLIRRHTQKHIITQQKITLSSSLDMYIEIAQKILCEGSRCSIRNSQLSNIKMFTSFSKIIPISFLNNSIITDMSRTHGETKENKEQNVQTRYSWATMIIMRSTRHKSSLNKQRLHNRNIKENVI